MLQIYSACERVFEMSTSFQVDRFCRQYLQLEPQLDFPDAHLLKEAEVQDSIYARLFAGAVQYGPPPRYRLRTLKELVSRIEASIDDWEQHVSVAMPVPRGRLTVAGRV